MATEHEVQVQEKRELQKKDESTIPARTFVPTTDIYETDQALTVVMEMPGVDKANLDVNGRAICAIVGARYTTRTPPIERNARTLHRTSVRSWPPTIGCLPPTSI